jgi:hypothetical protein
MYNNPLVSCQRFDDDEEGSETGDDEEETGDEEQEEHGDEELFVEEKIEKRNGRVALAEKNANVVTEGLRPARRVKA